MFAGCAPGTLFQSDLKLKVSLSFGFIYLPVMTLLIVTTVRFHLSRASAAEKSLFFTGSVQSSSLWWQNLDLFRTRTRPVFWCFFFLIITKMVAAEKRSVFDSPSRNLSARLSCGCFLACRTCLSVVTTLKHQSYVHVYVTYLKRQALCLTYCF